MDESDEVWVGAHLLEVTEPGQHLEGFVFFVEDQGVGFLFWDLKVESFHDLVLGFFGFNLADVFEELGACEFLIDRGNFLDDW